MTHFLLNDLLPWLFSMVTLINIIGYTPQIRALIRADAPPLTISLASWLLWFLGTGIYLLYAIVHIDDMRLIIVQAVNLLLETVIIVLILWSRYWRFKPSPASIHEKEKTSDELAPPPPL